MTFCDTIAGIGATFQTHQTRTWTEGWMNGKTDVEVEIVFQIYLKSIYNLERTLRPVLLIFCQTPLETYLKLR